MKASLTLFAFQTVLGITTSIHSVWCRTASSTTAHKSARLCTGCCVPDAAGTLRPGSYLQTCLFSSGCPRLALRAQESLKQCPILHQPRPCPLSFVWLEIPRPRSNLSPTLNSGLLQDLLMPARLSTAKACPDPRPAYVSAGRFSIWFTEIHSFHL